MKNYFGNALTMEKKYELLKDLPNINKGEIGVGNGFASYEFKDKFGCKAFINSKVIESSKDWFKEVVEKDWEIVAYNHIRTGGLSNMPSMHHDDPTSVHSVKRLSDGKIFSIGDEIQHGVMPIGGVAQIGKGIITRFEISKGTAFAEGKPRNWRFPLSNLHKSPPTPPTTLQDQDKFQYTEEDLRKAFEAAREIIKNSGGVLTVSACKYSSFKDYLSKQLNTEKEEVVAHYYGRSEEKYMAGVDPYRNENKNTSQPQNKERIEVNDIDFDSEEGWMKIYFNGELKTIPHVYKKIQQAIESIINS